jgi:SAM-dependent methyltransferase
MESSLNIRPLTQEQILASYDAVSKLYSRIPSLSLWRAWEHAAYQGLKLPEPVLDLGCGDGQFFSFLWPEVRAAIGVDHDTNVVDAARLGGVYQQVHLVSADNIPVPPESMASAFANCSLEHMDRLPAVLRRLHRSLRPEGPFLLSVVTDKLVEWQTLTLLAQELGDPRRARQLANEYKKYHHLENPLPPAVWKLRLEEAGFEVREHIPIVPEMTSRLFLLVDHVWHLQQSREETGTRLHSYLLSVPRFDEGFRQILAGVMAMEPDWSVGSGAVFLARRR